MKQPVLKNPYSSSNIYVRRNIVRENIIELTVFILSDDFKILPYLLKDEIRKQKDAAVSLSLSLEKQIKQMEQLSFPFGNTIL